MCVLHCIGEWKGEVGIRAKLHRRKLVTTGKIQKKCAHMQKIQKMHTC